MFTTKTMEEKKVIEGKKIHKTWQKLIRRK